MPNVNEVTRDGWILNTFPEWGTWLNEEIDETVVEKGTFAMWWLGCTGLWIKSEGGTNITVDYWCGSGKRTHAKKVIAPNHQMARMCGGVKMQPNLRAVPAVIDPFAITQLDAVLASHTHTDHIDINLAAAVLNNLKGRMVTVNGEQREVPFIGSLYATNMWKSWGVPEERLITVRPGDVVQVNDIKITAVESYDRTILITDPPVALFRTTWTTAPSAMSSRRRPARSTTAAIPTMATALPSTATSTISTSPSAPSARIPAA